MTVLELIRRAQRAQREHDRRIDVQLALDEVALSESGAFERLRSGPVAKREPASDPGLPPDSESAVELERAR